MELRFSLARRGWSGRAIRRARAVPLPGGLGGLVVAAALGMGGGLAAVLLLVNGKGVSSAWSAVPEVASARSQHTATMLQDGRVLVAGGMPERISSTAVRYGPP